MSNKILRDLLVKTTIDKDVSLENTDEIISNVPLLNDEIFNNLPNIFDAILDPFITNNLPKNRDIGFLSSLVTLSGMFPTVSSVYFGEKVYSNLMFFVVAKPADGKASMKVGKDILCSYEKRLIESNKRLQDNYILELREYEAIMSENKKLKDKTKWRKVELPKKPIEKHLHISPDISTAAFQESLLNGVPLMYTTEASSMSNTNKQDWGNYSDVFKRLFHHEDILKVRKEERVYIPEPKMSVLISGTMQQLFNTISNKEDGTFSRFMMYLYSSPREFISPFRQKQTVKDFLRSKNIPDKILQIIDFYSNKNISIELDENSIKIFNNFAKRFFENQKIYDIEGDLDAIFKRHLLMAYKITMILTILRNSDNSKVLFDDKLAPLEEDVRKGLQIFMTIMEHAKIISGSIRDEKPQLLKNKNETLIKLLKNKNEFNKQEAITLALANGISDTTLTRVLRYMIKNGNLEKVDKFNFRIINKNERNNKK